MVVASKRHGPYPFYRMLGGPRGRSELLQDISPPPGFESQAVQYVAGRFTDYATAVEVFFSSLYLHYPEFSFNSN
jgi:hypothetical protein